MARTLQLDIATPDRLIVSGPAEAVVAPGSEGEFGVLPGHAGFLSTLRAGRLRYRMDGSWHTVAVQGGFAEITPHQAVLLVRLAEGAEPPKQTP
jgi:F-type H+-transporting ATPase subunit epsilon